MIAGEVRERKAILKNVVRNAVRDFEDSTGIMIDSITINHFIKDGNTSGKGEFAVSIDMDVSL